MEHGQDVDSDCEEIPKEDVLEYAMFLGIDLEHEAHLLWIAHEGVCAKVPPPWEACTTAGDEEVFYFNHETGESTWEHPCDDQYKALVEEYRLLHSQSASQKSRTQTCKQELDELVGSHEASNMKEHRNRPSHVEDDDGTSDAGSQHDSPLEVQASTAEVPTAHAETFSAMGRGVDFDIKKGEDERGSSSSTPPSTSAGDAGPSCATTDIFGSLRHVISDDDDSLPEDSVPQDDDHSHQNMRQSRDACTSEDPPPQPASHSNAHKEPESAILRPVIKMQAASTLVGGRYSSQDVRLRSLIRVVHQQAEEHGPQHIQVASALIAVADHHKKHDHTVKEQDALIRALRLYEHSHGETNVNVADLLDRISEVSAKLGDSGLGQEMLERKQEILNRRSTHAGHAQQTRNLTDNAATASRGLAPIELQKDAESAKDPQRGLAGVGLAPARFTSVRADMENDSDEDVPNTSGTSSNRSLNHSNSGTRSQSSGRAFPAAVPRRDAAHSSLSEVSEDFLLSEVDGASANGHGGDTLELSNSAAEEGTSGAADAIPGEHNSMDVQRWLSTKDGHVAQPNIIVDRPACMGKTSDHVEGQTLENAASAIRAPSHLIRINSQLKSLASCVSMLKDIREKQQQYMRILHAQRIGGQGLS